VNSRVRRARVGGGAAAREGFCEFLLREWKVTQQSTLLAFRGKTEKMRSTSESDPEALRKVFQAAL